MFWIVLGNAFFIFALRVASVAMSTVRTVLTVRGLRIWSALIGFVEVTIWVLAISQVINDLDNIWNLIGYSGGFAAGTLLGMWIEDTSDDYMGSDYDYHTFNPGDDEMLVDEVLDGKYLSDVVCKFMYLGVLQPDETITVVQTFHMDKDTTNWAQGDYLEWDEDYVAQQVNNPNAPGEELDVCAKY